jgi:hypothetical protein
MPLRLNMSISQDGNAEPIRLKKLFQVVFLNELRQRTGGIVSVYTGIVFEGAFTSGRDDPALIIGLSSDSNQTTRCADLTASFGSQQEPIQTFWGIESHPVNNANPLRDELEKVEPEAALGPVTDLIDVTTTANFGVSDRRFRFKPAGGFG